MDDVQVRRDGPLRYASKARQLGPDAIDAYVRETIAELRRLHLVTGRPFTFYLGCDKADEQLVEVCVPTDSGDRELPAQNVAFTTARGAECDYPAILAAYDAVVAYAREEGQALGTPRETYLTDLDATTQEMEVAFPILTS